MFRKRSNYVFSFSNTSYTNNIVVSFVNVRGFKNELCHDKTNIMGLRPAWIQTSLRIRAVRSGSILFAISFSTCYRVCKRTAWSLIRLRGWSGSMLVANPLCLFCHDGRGISKLLPSTPTQSTPVWRNSAL
jgi:hypothetical protein